MVAKKKVNIKQLELNLFSNSKIKLKKSIIKNKTYNSVLHSELKKIYAELDFYTIKEKTIKLLKKSYGNFDKNKLKLSKDYIKNRLKLIEGELASFKLKNNSKHMSSGHKAYFLYLEKLNTSSKQIIKLIDNYIHVDVDYKLLSKNAEYLKRSYLKAGDKDAAGNVTDNLNYYHEKKRNLKNKILNQHTDYLTKFTIFANNIDLIKQKLNVK